jgi:GAF domain-containing protein
VGVLPGQPVGLSAALVELGRRVVTGVPVAALLDEAVSVVARELRADQVDVLERVDGGLRLRAACGAAAAEIGGVVDMPDDGYAQAVFSSGDAVVSEDLTCETRFRPSPMLIRAGVVSGMGVVIPGSGGSGYGIVGVHATAPRSWKAEEIDFVRNVASIAGAAIARRRQALELNDDILQALVVTRYALDRDDAVTARDTLDAALASAREMISALLGEDGHAADALPGDLRRS